MGKLLCWLGLHDWWYYHDATIPVRQCVWCSKEQRGRYDPMYGSTDYE